MSSVVVIAAIATSGQARLPEPVREMIDAATATGDSQKVAAVIEAPKTAYPDATAQIDELHAAWQIEQKRLAEARKAQEHAALASAGFLENWEGDGEIGAIRSTGNTDDLGASLGLTLEKDGVDWDHTLRTLVDYQQSDGVTTREQYLLEYKTRYDLYDRTYVLGLERYERAARFQGYTARYSLSGGVGYRLIESDSATLRIQAGPAYRRTDFVDGEVETQNSLAALAALDFDWRLAENITFQQDVNAVLQSGNSTFQSFSAFRAGITDDVSVRVILRDRARYQSAARRCLDRYVVAVHLRFWFLAHCGIASRRKKGREGLYPRGPFSKL